MQARIVAFLRANASTSSVTSLGQSCPKPVAWKGGLTAFLKQHAEFEVDEGQVTLVKQQNKKKKTKTNNRDRAAGSDSDEELVIIFRV